MIEGSLRDLEVSRAIIKKNGEKHQASVCIEECSELIKELTKFLRTGKKDKMHMAEEVADVLITLRHLTIIFLLTDEDISLFHDFKMDRLAHWYLKGDKK